MPYDIPGLRREKQYIREGDADPVMLKFSSSAAHISGKPLTSSESFTWLREHFNTALSQCKPEVEDLWLNGVNHVFLHGSTYSPKRAEWPGWKFYAAVNFNATNTIWEDAPGLFSYIASCQSMLQEGTSDNEALLYWPVYDNWGKFLDGSLFIQYNIHSLNAWLHGTSFYETARLLMQNGYGLDFISDNFIARAQVKNGKIVLPGGTFKALVVPYCEKMPLITLEKLFALKKAGGTVIFEGLPESVPGFYQYERRHKELARLLMENKTVVPVVTNVERALQTAGVYPETLVDTGLKYIRRDVDGEKNYLLVNHTPKEIYGFIPLAIGNKEVVIFDPMTKDYGNALVQKKADVTLVKLQIKSGQSFILKTEQVASKKKWKYYKNAADEIGLNGDWEITFDKGGPQLPPKAKISKLESWTTLSPEAEAFSGSATYRLQFSAPNIAADTWKLDLGDVRESAKVWLNGAFIGDVWSVPYEINLGKLKKGKNTLTIQVTNLGANRVRDMEMRGKEWKHFYEINMVNKDYKKFDATKWDVAPSGLLGPVLITPLKQDK